MTASEQKEYFDAPDVLKTKIKKLAELIKKSSHCVMFTGAGISTSAGIRDFRSGINTVLDTGGGAWAKNTAVKEGKYIKKAKRKAIDITKAYPTAAHLSIVQLIKNQYVKYLISQNCDGLHIKSGIPSTSISELHGNSYIEICNKCNTKYIRDYKVRDSLIIQNPHQHKTGRKCIQTNCDGDLCDTIINFNESLPVEPLNKALIHSQKSDLYISMGSSLAVTPASNMPQYVGNKWLNGNKDCNLCIINIQKTPLHYLCSLPIFAKIDDVMIGLMNELNINIPQFYLFRYIKISVENINNNNHQKMLIISTINEDGIYFTFLYEIIITFDGNEIHKIYNNKRTNKCQNCACLVPNWSKSQLQLPGNNQINQNNDNDNKNNDNDKELIMKLSFFSNYSEPKLSIVLNDFLDDLLDNNGFVILKLIFDTSGKQWKVLNKKELLKDENVQKLYMIYNNSNDNDCSDNDNDDNDDHGN